MKADVDPAIVNAQVQKKYEFPTSNRMRSSLWPRSIYLPSTDPEHFTAEESFEVIWAGRRTGFFGSEGNGGRGGSCRSVRWSEVCDKMVGYFGRLVYDVSSSRPLSREDLAVLAEDEGPWRNPSTPARRAAQQGGSVDDVVINLEALRPFWVWFWQATLTLRRTRAWWLGESRGVRGFAGFVKKSDVVTLLSGRAPGTFLIRFSASRPGALAIHYASVRERGMVRDVLVNVTDSGSLSCEDSGPQAGRQVLTYSNLEDLVRQMSHLTRFHPDTPKGEIIPFRRSLARHRMSMQEGEHGRLSGGREAGMESQRRHSMEETRRRASMANGTSRVSMSRPLRPPVSSLERASAHA